MKILCLLLLSALAITFAKGRKLDFIVGGNFSRIEEAPYQALSLSVERGVNGSITISKCGASIISEYWLLSAAHCFLTPLKGYGIAKANIRNIKIFTGLDSISKLNIDNVHKIEKVFTYKGFNFDDIQHDISLIKLKTPMKFSAKVRPIELATSDPAAGDEVTLSGYGQQSLSKNDKHEFDELRKAVVKVIGREQCNAIYQSAEMTNIEDRNFTKSKSIWDIFPKWATWGNFRRQKEKKPIKPEPVIKNTMFCAGLPNVGTCFGDSGGPAVINEKLAGIVSFGSEKCGSEKFFGVFTRVDRYVDWIKKIISKN